MARRESTEKANARSELSSSTNYRGVVIEFRPILRRYVYNLPGVGREWEEDLDRVFKKIDRYMRKKRQMSIPVYYVSWGKFEEATINSIGLDGKFNLTIGTRKTRQKLTRFQFSKTVCDPTEDNADKLGQIALLKEQQAGLTKKVREIEDSITWINPEELMLDES